ncbi:Zn-dependent peptidase ImmA (M78 family) [Desulfitispora alkaliphila]|uniref:ImmA/IrrE family metallo-endopeptidase n=1 Tax=Desulfitispora alkaliphila TaxID=622674 RepID=UPI003D191B81
MRIDTTEVEKRALDIRQEHNIQTYGVKDIYSLINQRGIHLIRYPFGKDILLGFSTIFEGKRIVVSNSSEILSREIYTIAHELGHIIYDFEDDNQDVKIDIEIENINESISEARAFHFANCLLMPGEELLKFIKFELKKNTKNLNALDIVRIQVEFQVSYASAVKRLFDINAIDYRLKNELFNERNEITSRSLFKIIDADEKLLKPSNTIKVPSQYLEYVITNYENGYIPYSSINKSLALLGIDSKIFKKDDSKEDEELDIDDIFEEFE